MQNYGCSVIYHANIEREQQHVPSDFLRTVFSMSLKDHVLQALWHHSLWTLKLTTTINNMINRLNKTFTKLKQSKRKQNWDFIQQFNLHELDVICYELLSTVIQVSFQCYNSRNLYFCTSMLRHSRVNLKKNIPI